MRPSEAEILAGIRRVQADLSPALPPELVMTGQDVAAVRIRLQVLRGQLEFPPEQEETPLPLASLLALLTELVGHTADTNSVPESHSALLAALRSAILTGDVLTLRNALAQQHRARTPP